VIEPMGAESYIHYRLAESAFVSRVDAHRKYKVGESSEPAVFIDKAHFFDASSGKRIG
jgi:multiple sugar transport system ATP-binding protein